MPVYDVFDSTEKGFLFTPTTTSYLKQIEIVVVCFNTSLTGSRKLRIKIRNGGGLAGTVLYTGDISIPSATSTNTNPYRVVLNINSGNLQLTQTNPYTLSIRDITSSGISGYVRFFGIGQDGVNYTSYNSIIYPALNLSYKLQYPVSNILFNQTNDTTRYFIPNSTEVGFTFTSPESSYFNSNYIYVYSSTTTSRSFTTRLREGSGLNGKIMYSFTQNLTQSGDTFIGNTFISFSPYNEYPYLEKNKQYTLTLQQTSGPYSTVEIKSIPDTVPPLSFNTGGKYAYFEIGVNSKLFDNIIQPFFQDSGILVTAFTQSISNTVVENLSGTEKGYELVSAFTGNVSVIKLTLTSFGTRTMRVRVRSGSGLLGPFIFTKDMTVAYHPTRYNFEILPQGSLSFIEMNTYTISFTDISASPAGLISIYGIPTSPSYIAYNSSIYPKLSISIPSYTITISPPALLSGFLGSGLDSVEFNSQARDNATILSIDNLPITRAQYYAIRLQYINLPNKILNVVNGGALDNYPYIYIQIFNDGNRGSFQIMNSNNPNSIRATFKVPINKYLYNIPTSFFTLKYTGPDQIILFRPDQDIRLTITLPDGTVLNFADEESFSPLSPNPFIQISTLFSLIPIEEYQ